MGKWAQEKRSKKHQANLKGIQLGDSQGHWKSTYMGQLLAT